MVELKKPLGRRNLFKNSMNLISRDRDPEVEAEEVKEKSGDRSAHKHIIYGSDSVYDPTVGSSGEHEQREPSTSSPTILRCSHLWTQLSAPVGWVVPGHIKTSSLLGSLRSRPCVWTRLCLLDSSGLNAATHGNKPPADKQQSKPSSRFSLRKKMASRSEDLRCPVCHDIFRDPVVLTCSHSFCNDCLHSWWNEKGSRECPVCKAVCSMKKPPVSLVLKNLCMAFSLERDQTAPEGLCSLHSEKLKLFCLDHQQPVCLVCRDSEKHTDHRFRPIDEAARRHKKQLNLTLIDLRMNMHDFEEAKFNFDQTADHMKFQARYTERQIKEQFEKLRRFLQKEEEARLAALREEEEQKSRVLKEKMEALNRDMPALLDTIRATEEQLRADDVSFLLNYKAAMERAKQHLLLKEPFVPSGALIDEAKHLGNLTFDIWNKMKDMVSYTPVIPDPNTAGSLLVLSEDLSSVTTRKEEWPVPGNPERLHDFFSVLGSEILSSGTHSWDVEVGDGSAWELGAVAQSVFENGEEIESGLWSIALNHEGSYSARSPSAPPSELKVKKKLGRIRVNLDWNRETLSFSDPDANGRIHTFRHAFPLRMRPYFNIEGKLKILPLKVCVTQQHV